MPLALLSSLYLPGPILAFTLPPPLSPFHPHCSFLSLSPFTYSSSLSLYPQMAQQDGIQSSITETLVANMGASAYAQPGSWGYPTQTTTDMNGVFGV